MTIENEVQAISTTSSLRNYLEMIYEIDQRYRLEAQEAVTTYGYDSPEHTAIWKKINQTDASNYLKISLILNEFGYPHIDSVGEDAANAPWLVIHHTPFYEHKSLNFPIVYQGYLDGSVDENAMGLYLDRMYHITNGEMFHMVSPYRMNDKIDTLIKALSLDEYFSDQSLENRNNY